jgi:Fringe-like
MSHSAKFCLAKGPNCISFPAARASCGPLVPSEEIFFAVKTCGKFHKSRVPFVLQTWAKKTNHFAMYTDTPGKYIATFVMKHGGH